MPGVSRKAICPRGSLRMPTMRLRVVCGLGETMATFWPRMRLSSVDLPALGRPTRATIPNAVIEERETPRRLPLFHQHKTSGSLANREPVDAAQLIAERHVGRRAI